MLTKLDNIWQKCSLGVLAVAVTVAVAAAAAAAAAEALKSV